MPGSGTGTFIDADDYEASLSRLRFDLLVTSQGGFKAQLTWATLGCAKPLPMTQPDIPSPNCCVANVLDFLTRRFGHGI
jgi:hypothetical protein